MTWRGALKDVTRSHAASRRSPADDPQHRSVRRMHSLCRVTSVIYTGYITDVVVRQEKNGKNFYRAGIPRGSRSIPTVRVTGRLPLHRSGCVRPSDTSIRSRDVLSLPLGIGSGVVRRLDPPN